MRDRLTANNAASKWVPEFVSERRFHNVARVSHVIRPPNLTVGT